MKGDAMKVVRAVVAVSDPRPHGPTENLRFAPKMDPLSKSNPETFGRRNDFEDVKINLTHFWLFSLAAAGAGCG
jgi:hypothetical protein